MNKNGMILCAAAALCWLFRGDVSASEEAAVLYDGFRNPPKEYSAVPFWSWNGTLEPDKLRWQVREMADKGIYGAFMHARAGIEVSGTPYFSKGWWDAVEAVLDEADAAGFYPHLYDEDKWPSGSAGGRTRAADSLLNSKKALRYTITELSPGEEIGPDYPENVMAVIAVRTGGNALDIESLIDLTGRKEKWSAPGEGSWQLWTFTQHIEQDGVNYLRRQTVRTFMDITHEEYYRRFGKYFGTTIPGLFFDEISAGPHNSDLVWTDDFFDQFRRMKGYDLRKFLPLLFADAGERSPVIRCDYYEVYTSLYADSWFRQISEWCEERGIYLTGHTYEDVNSYISQGDYFRTWEPVQVPGTDNEDFRYTFPKRIGWFKPKQIGSLAHTTGKKRIMGEILGGAGWGVTPEELRYGVGMLGIYGLNLFVPHLFHYSMDTPLSMDDWPNSWFYQNPYWKYFKPLADYMRRISFMNSQGRYVCDIAILFPVTSQWASGVTVMRTNTDPGGGAYGGKLQDDYIAIQEYLLDNFQDFDVLHPDYLARSSIEGKKINAGEGRYGILVIPPITTIRRDVLAKLREFFYGGGIIIAAGQLPTDSREGGKNDPEVLKAMWEIFRVNPLTMRNGYDESMPDLAGDYIVNSYPSPGDGLNNPDRKVGTAFFTKKINEIPEIVSAMSAPDITVSGKHASTFLYHHRVSGDLHIYDVMNKSKNRESYTVNFKTTGIPEIWDPVSGAKKPVPSFLTSGDGKTEIHLSLLPWENFYIVFKPAEPGSIPAGLIIEETNLRDVSVTGYRHDTATLSGWMPAGEKAWFANGRNGSRTFRISGDAKEDAEAITIAEGWKFLPVPHEPDEGRVTELLSARLPLPAMDFRIERIEGEALHYGWAEKKDGRRGWKQVKIFDSLHPEEGCSRYASLWDGYWISYYDFRQFPGDMGFGNSPDLYFRREIQVHDAVSRGWISVLADGKCDVMLNGALLFKESGYENGRTEDITKELKAGRNELFIRIGKAGHEKPAEFPHGVLLMQGEILCGSGERIALYSDDSWAVSRDGVNWRPAFEVASPPMGIFGDPWRGGERIEYPATLWYRQELPPGSHSLEEPAIRGEYWLYVNGKEIPRRSAGPINIRRYCSAAKNVISVRVRAQSGREGIIRPLEINLEPADIGLGDWSEQGLSWYSGMGAYSNTFRFSQTGDRKSRRWILDPGKLFHCGEIRLNGKLIHESLWTPFACDVTDYLAEGENTVTIAVGNLLANQMLWDMYDDAASNLRSIWWHRGSILREAEKLASGLVGPVRLVPYKRISGEFKMQ